MFAFYTTVLLLFVESIMGYTVWNKWLNKKCLSTVASKTKHNFVVQHLQNINRASKKQRHANTWNSIRQSDRNARKLIFPEYRSKLSHFIDAIYSFEIFINLKSIDVVFLSVQFILSLSTTYFYWFRFTWYFSYHLYQ